MTQHFKTNEAQSGLLMVISMIAALMLANTTNLYFDFVDSPIIFLESQTLKSLVKDFLMVVFFIYVGMELRKEYQEGCLSNHREIILPFIATIGGMLIPALIYLAVNINYPENYPGFAIPCSTDIAFSICLFGILGRGLPQSIKIFLLSIAIFDDIGAILIIAAFYTNNFQIIWLLASLVPITVFWFLNKYLITHNYLYILFALILTICFYKAGISTSIAGFLIGFLLPLYDKSGSSYSKALSLRIQPIIQFFILPIFAFVSSGISFGIEHIKSLFDPIVLGIVLGLFVGKQLGITLFAYITLRFGIATLPIGSKLVDIYIVSIFAGIGFTMSLFVGMTGFHDMHSQNLVKLGVMAAFVICVLFSGLVRCVMDYQAQCA